MNLLLKNFLCTFSVRCMVLMSGFIVSIFSAHFLGPVGRGKYFFVTSLSVLLVQICSLGIPSSSTFLVAKNPAVLGKLMINSMWISLILGLGSTVIITGFFHLRHSASEVMLIIMLVPASLFYLFGTNLLIGINKIKVFNLFQISSNLGVGIILLYCGYLGFTAKGFLVGTSLAWLLAAILMFCFISRLAAINYKFDFEIFRKGFNFGIKSYMACLLPSMLVKSNIFILKYFTSSEILGYYSIASQINDVISSLPATFSLLLFPEIIKNPETGWKKTQSAVVGVASFLLLGEILLAFLAPRLIPFVFGAKFSTSVIILWCMLPGAFSLCIISIMSQYLAANGFPLELILFWVIGFLFMLILSFFLIPQFAGIGAALSLSITYAFLACIIGSFAYRFKNKIQNHVLSEATT